AAAAKLAFNRAAELFSKAIGLLSGDSETRRELYKHMGDALANAGRGAQAAEAYLKAAERSPESDARTLERMATRQYLRSGVVSEGFPLAQRLLKSVGLSYPQTMASALTQFVWNRAFITTRPTRFVEPTEIPAVTRQRLDTLEAIYQE